MTQNFIIVCETAIIDKDTNNLYLFGIFEKIYAPVVPVLFKFAIVTNFKEGNGEHDHRIDICFEDDVIASLPGKINFSSTGKAQYIGRFLGLPFKQFGKYTIKIYVDGILQSLIGELNVEQSN